MRVYLTGFMGAGKTTVGRLLADRLGCPFIDLDAMVEDAAGCTVREVFATEGEAGFRIREHRALAETLRLERVVVATGGGTLTFETNRALIAERGLIAWLNPPFEMILRRIGVQGKSDRPLFRSETEALALYRDRLPAYRQADVTVDVAVGEQPEEVAARMALLLGGRL
jgi:shikimate kinase